MTAPEIADVLQASREALGYASLRLSLTLAGSGPDVLMAPDGRPIFFQERTPGVRLTHYTRHAPQRCDGSFGPGELVVEYEKRGNEWTASARQWRSASEPFGQIFAMLSGEVPLEDVGRAAIAGRQARALRAAWSAPGAVQTLWVDEATFVPLRWAVSASTQPGAAAPAGTTPIESGIFFSYDNSIDLRPPDGILPPACLDPADDPAVSRPPR